MDLYKQAAILKLRVLTSFGQLTVEQLMDLSLTKLATIIKNLKKDLVGTKDDELSFLDESVVVDQVKQLTFDILKDIYITKKSENDLVRQQAANKEHNEKIKALIAKKQDQKLEDYSIEDLAKLLKD